MTTVTLPTAAPPAEARPKATAAEVLDRLRGPLRVLAAFVAALVLFGIVIALKGVNPITAYKDMFVSTFTSWDSIAGIVVRSTPIILAALAVTVPARAGLINVGGEGQMIMGGIGAMGVSLLVDGGLPGGLTLVLMVLAAAACGAGWSLLAGVLRRYMNISESVTTLLLNYVALDLMFFLIYDRWKDRNGTGQPTTRALPVSERLSLIGWGRVHSGLFIAIGAAVIVALVFRYTSWGFRLRVVGGNAEAARRSGLKVGALLLSAMAVGGALAGLGGLTQLAGAEFKLRSGFIATYGYIGFLASWLGRHRPMYVVLSSFLLSAIAISGDSLQLDSQLPAASVNILMSLVLLMVLGFGTKRKVSA